MKKVLLFLLCFLVVLPACIEKNDSTKKPGTIVLFNGTPATGKSSIIKALQKIYGDTYVTVLGDEFVKTYSLEHPKPESMTDDTYQVQVLSALCKQVKQLSLDGKNVFAELVQFDENYDHYCSILDCEKVVKILVYCPLDIVVDRLAERNKTVDVKVDLLIPLQLFSAIYTLQESENELIVDRIQTSRMKYALQAATQEVNKLIKEAGANASFEDDPFYKDFTKQFTLDDAKEIVLVPTHPWDLVVNSGIHSPQEIAQTITEFLDKKRAN